MYLYQTVIKLVFSNFFCLHANHLHVLELSLHEALHPSQSQNEPGSRPCRVSYLFGKAVTYKPAKGITIARNSNSHCFLKTYVNI